MLQCEQINLSPTCIIYVPKYPESQQILKILSCHFWLHIFFITNTYEIAVLGFSKVSITMKVNSSGKYVPLSELEIVGLVSEISMPVSSRPHKMVRLLHIPESPFFVLCHSETNGCPFLQTYILKNSWRNAKNVSIYVERY